jgi:hypothetical protein
MTHSWCSELSRDAAVRAAEDNRTGPLPTLAEAISRPFAETAERSVPVSKTGEGQRGMRTERVTLEVTHDGKHGPVSTWPFECGSHGKGVRVVEEACPDAWAQTFARLEAERHAAIRELSAEKMWRDNLAMQRNEIRDERDALRARVAELEAASGGGADPVLREARLRDESRTAEYLASLDEASGGGEGEPVAYFVKWNEKDWGVQDQTFRTLQRAQDYIKDEKSEDENPQIVPLYDAPPQPRGWLSEEERKAIERARREAECDAGLCSKAENAAIGARDATVLAALLARSSPPEVVLPLADLGDRLLRDGVIDALAAAGVTVTLPPGPEGDA